MTSSILITALLALLLLTIAHSWVIPHDLPDGHYHIAFPASYNHTHPSPSGNVTITALHRHRRHRRQLKPNPSGSYDAPNDAYNEDSLAVFGPAPLRNEEMFRKLPPLRPAGRYANLIPLPVTSFDCIFDAPQFNVKEHREAEAALREYCDTFMVRPKTAQIQVSKSGRVAVYACNYRREHNTCSSEEWDHAKQHWLDGRCGMLRPGYVTMIDQARGYGRAWIGQQICHEQWWAKTEGVTWQGLPPPERMREQEEEEEEDKRKKKDKKNKKKKAW
ncbi:hypothetical protein S40288_10856 [Stachybotrys chartarum IBT 40288]|nr:hypothetical protein S40288_10856 [Stachybotrys chartarum IBT 40288]